MGMAGFGGGVVFGVSLVLSKVVPVCVLCGVCVCGWVCVRVCVCVCVCGGECGGG